MQLTINWLSIDIDSDLKNVLKLHNENLNESLNLPANMDGFFFTDKDGFTVLFDVKNNCLAYLDDSIENCYFKLNYKIIRVGHGKKRLYCQNKILIKDAKKFYYVFSKKTSSLYYRLDFYLNLLNHAKQRIFSYLNFSSILKRFF